MNTNTKLAGYFKIEVVKPDGTEKMLAEFPNLITDWGLDRIGTNADYLTYCQVGSGSSTPLVTQTGLDSWVASTNSYYSSYYANSNYTTIPYYVQMRRIYQFAVGAISGNIQEIGVGTSSTGNLFSRALILDNLGAPTVLTILSTDILKVTYYFRTYVSELDTTGTVELNGITYNWICRVSDLDNVTHTRTNASKEWSSYWYSTLPTNYYSTYVYTGDIGSITGIPGGTGDYMQDAPSKNAYVAGTYSRQFTFNWSLTQGNLTGGIRSLKINMCCGAYQIQFDPNIPKDGDSTMSLTFEHSWERYTIV